MAKEKIYQLGQEKLQSQRERNDFRLAGLPSQILRYPSRTYLRGMAIVEKLKLIEEQMTEWEDKQPLSTLELLPWWENRRRYRELKLLREVPEVTWWEAPAFIEGARPTGLTNGYQWRISPRGRGDYTLKNKKLP
jgi:hypothetical protein